MEHPEEARLWQQCTANCGCVGSWIAPAGTKNNISPIFSDTAELFRWLHANGWESRGKYLSGRYVKVYGS